MKPKIAGSKLVSLILVVLFSAACATPQPETTLAPPTTTEAPELNPSARGYASMAYDSESDKMILFGGELPGYDLKINDETWAYDVASNTWIEMKPTSGPPPRCAVDIVYDSKSDRIILFGGASGATRKTASVLNDTWAYDYNTNTWTEMAKGPEDHLGYRMAYDSESDRSILFGGMDLSFKLYNDTWAYDFNTDTWTEMQPSTSPPVRNYHAMAYDIQADRVILFGGSAWDENMNTTFLDDTWAYDFNTNTWQQLERGEGEYPSGRLYNALAYNTVADRTILYGGVSAKDQPIETANETWLYDYSSNNWTLLKPAENPGWRTMHPMAYSSAADRIILFGGQNVKERYNYTDDTWVFDLNTTTWTDVTRRP
jgi:N-acetylneuraminic acid mutarotase